MDILHEEFTPAIRVEKLLISIQSLLCEPEANDPIDFIAAEQFKISNHKYRAQVRE